LIPVGFARGSVRRRLPASSTILSAPFPKYGRVFQGNRSLTVAAPIRAARVSKRSPDTLANF
jgi:hypothetical protein